MGIFREQAQMIRLSVARLEHELWCQDKHRAGWTYADGPRSPIHKTHPDLVVWEKLPESEKEKNREMVRGIPNLLMRAGYQTERK